MVPWTATKNYTKQSYLTRFSVIRLLSYLKALQTGLTHCRKSIFTLRKRLCAELDWVEFENPGGSKVNLASARMVSHLENIQNKLRTCLTWFWGPWCYPSTSETQKLWWLLLLTTIQNRRTVLVWPRSRSKGGWVSNEVPHNPGYTPNPQTEFSRSVCFVFKTPKVQ